MAGMTPTVARSNLELARAREAEALDNLAELISRLEATAERVDIATEHRDREIEARDALVFEAVGAGLTLELVARLSGLKHAPHAHRAKARHKARLVRRARERRMVGDDG